MNPRKRRVDSVHSRRKYLSQSDSIILWICTSEVCSYIGSKTKNLLVLDAVDNEVRVGDLVGAGQYPWQVAHHEQSDDDDGDVGHVQLLQSQIINYLLKYSTRSRFFDRKKVCFYRHIAPRCITLLDRCMIHTLSSPFLSSTMHHSMI